MGSLSSFAKVLLRDIATAGKVICFIDFTNTHLCKFSTPWGPSMLPTFPLTGSLVIAEKISQRFGKVRSGDIVMVRSPEDPRKVTTKRVKAMEGETVTYVVDPINSDRSETVVVPKGHLWVEGDNIYNSRDSRNFGAVPYGLLEGRVFWRVWPPKEFGSLGQR